MVDDPEFDRRYVFICGMPRSGTSMLGRNVGRLVDCTDLKNTGTFEDEGQNLQNVYPTAGELGDLVVLALIHEPIEPRAQLS